MQLTIKRFRKGSNDIAPLTSEKPSQPPAQMRTIVPHFSYNQTNQSFVFQLKDIILSQAILNSHRNSL